MKKFFELSALYARMSIGTGIKTLGYLLITAGIFLSWKNKHLALQLVYFGVGFVAVGWLIMIRTLLMAKTLNIPKLRLKSDKKRTRIVTSFKGDYVISEWEDVTIAGRVQYYDEDDKTWKPAKGKLRVFLDDEFYKDLSVDGDFEFKISAKAGKHSISFRFVGDESVEHCYKTVNFNVVSKFEKSKIKRNVKFAYILLLALFMVPVVLFIFLH